MLRTSEGTKNRKRSPQRQNQRKRKVISSAGRKFLRWSHWSTPLLLIGPAELGSCWAVAGWPGSLPPWRETMRTQQSVTALRISRFRAETQSEEKLGSQAAYKGFPGEKEGKRPQQTCWQRCVHAAHLLWLQHLNTKATFWMNPVWLPVWDILRGKKEMQKRLMGKKKGV